MSSDRVARAASRYQAKSDTDYPTALRAVFAHVALAMAQHLPRELIPGLLASAGQALGVEASAELESTRVTAWQFLEGKHGTSGVVADREDQAVRVLISIAWDTPMQQADIDLALEFVAAIVSDQPGLLDVLDPS